jgi:hypothetical protein
MSYSKNPTILESDSNIVGFFGFSRVEIRENILDEGI